MCSCDCLSSVVYIRLLFFSHVFPSNIPPLFICFSASSSSPSPPPPPPPPPFPLPFPHRRPSSRQVDMHVFGGNATTSVLSACYCIFRSLLSAAVLFGVCFGSLNATHSASSSSPSVSSNAFFSVFCALCVGFSYHLSRSASDPAVLWQILKNHLWPGRLTAEDEIKEG